MSDITTLMMGAAGAGGGAETDPNFNQTVLLLHGDGTNGAQNNTFLDSSTNNFTITRNGNTTQGTFSPFSLAAGEFSNFFDGTNDRLTIADNAVLRPGTGNFTIEAWVYRAAAGAAHTVFAKGGASTGFVLGITSGNVLRFTHTTTNIDSTGTVAANDWVHVAVVREGTGTDQVKLYINGVQDGQGTVSTDFNQTEEARIGENRGATDDFNGYISNFRYVVGSAIYTTAFTPSTSPLTTTSQGAVASEVELLTCQSNRFLDNSTNGFTVTPVNNTSVQPFSPFLPSAAYSPSVNGGSGYFDGSGDFLSIPSSSAFSIATSTTPFTVESWVYITAAGGAIFAEQFTGGGDTVAIAVTLCNGSSVDTTTGRFIGFGYYSGSWTSAAISTTEVPLNQWTHVACVFTGATTKIFLNGVDRTKASSPTPATTWGVTGDNGDAWYVGRRWAAVATEFISGYISSFRFVNGTAVYTTTFTPPTAPFDELDEANTELLLNYTNAGIFDNTGKNNLETVGNAQIDTGTKKYGTGSMEFDGTGDHLLTNGDIANFAFGSGDFTIEFWARLNNTTGAQILYDGRPASAQTTQPTIFLSSGTLYYYTNGATRITGNLLSINTWYHIAVTRSGTSTKMFVDGTQVGSAYTDSTVYTNTSGRPFIGADSFNSGSPPGNFFNGYIDDLRITKGVARYTAAFTPPTAAFPDQ